MVACPSLADTSRIVRIAGADGVVLCAEQRGSGAPSLLFAHGFGQTRHAWAQTADAFAREGRASLSVDGRGHGDSGWVEHGAYRLDQFIADAHAVSAHATPRPIWVGASMGGLIGLIAQAESAQRAFSALVLVDITPRWEARGVERILSFMRARPEGFATVEDAQAAVARYLPHRAQSKSPKRLEKLLVRMANGRLRWHWDPKLLDTVAEEVGEWSARVHAAARALAVPVLLVSGGRSDVVSARTIEEFLALAPHAEHVCIDDATHVVAGDANDRFTDVISEWIARVAPSAPQPATVE